jgi:hypothetical protein
MGFVTEAKILKQDKKAQSETNGRLDALIAEQQRTNELLTHLLHVLAPQAAQQPPTQWGPPAQR